MQRHPGPELLDQVEIPTPDLYRNLYELERINMLLGGHSVSILGLKKILAAHKIKDKTIHLCDVGCGGGDTLRAIAIFCRKHKIKVKLTGVDLKKDCIEYAGQHSKDFPEIHYIQQDYRLVDQQFDIISAALFNHHFTLNENQEIVAFMHKHSNLGWFINDLHRHPFAMWSIYLLVQLFSSSYLVKHDAPLSVQRGFLYADWLDICAKANIPHVHIQWKWAFRYLICAVHENKARL